jgi:serine protease Do
MFIHALLAIAFVTPPAMPQTPPVVATASATTSISRTPPRTRHAEPRKHTTFGVAIAPVSEAIRDMPYLHADEGVVLTTVQPGGAAEAAGLRAGDMVLTVSGKYVDETTLYGALRAEPRNHAFRVEFLREGKWKDTWVTIEQ